MGVTRVVSKNLDGMKIKFYNMIRAALENKEHAS